MDRIFQIGDFVFRLGCPAEITPPENFMKFECESESFEYTYQINVSDTLPDPEGKVIAQRPDLAVFRCETEAGESLECRLIGVKGNPEYYACYQEVSENCAEVTLIWERIAELHIDPIFTSLLALERRLVERNSMILHCAYVEYQGEAILFSAPSETGKTTQANLWERWQMERPGLAGVRYVRGV